MRKVPTADDRVMHRARISSNDMQQAVSFIDAALAAEARGANSKTDVTHLALVVAAVIYYARPFGPNEGRPKKKREVPPKGEPPLSTVDIGPLSMIISSKEGRRLHRSVITLRNKVVAHAESRYFLYALSPRSSRRVPGAWGTSPLRAGRRTRDST